MACEINNIYLLKSRSKCIMYKPVSGAFELETKCNYGTAVGLGEKILPFGFL